MPLLIICPDTPPNIRILARYLASWWIRSREGTKCKCGVLQEPPARPHGTECINVSSMLHDASASVGGRHIFLSDKCMSHGIIHPDFFLFVLETMPCQELGDDIQAVSRSPIDCCTPTSLPTSADKLQPKLASQIPHSARPMPWQARGHESIRSTGTPRAPMTG
jgi:hypothetical protein